MLKKLKRFFYLHILHRKYYRTGQCLGCGRCCQKIYVQTSKHVIKEEKEFERLKLLNRFYTYLEVIDKDETGLVFKCNKQDPKTNLCTIHNNRPGICRRYPQEELFKMGGAIDDDCGYKMIPIVSFSEVLEKKLKK